MTYTRSDRYHYDLEWGKDIEKKYAELYAGKKVEIKAERGKWINTGNIFVEFVRLEHKDGNVIEYPSGIATTEAEHWVQVLTTDDKHLFGAIDIKVSHLKEIIEKRMDSDKPLEVKGGLEGSRGYLIPLAEIFADLAQIADTHRNEGGENV